MPKIGPLELVLVLAIVLLIFGAGRLPEIGSALGKSIRAFKRSSSDDETGDSKKSKDKEQDSGQNTKAPPKQQ